MVNGVARARAGLLINCVEHNETNRAKFAAASCGGGGGGGGSGRAGRGGGSGGGGMLVFLAGLFLDKIKEDGFVRFFFE